MAINNMDPNLAEETSDKIARCFREIEATRMAGIPILNRALGVEVIGLQEFAGEWLCILVTPWFMNVMLLPTHGKPASDERIAVPGTKQTVAFPAGRFEMINGYEPALGRYRMCSLFSPVLEFADQESAIATAQAALNALLLADEEDQDADDRDMAMIWRGERPSREPSRQEDGTQSERSAPASEECNATAEAKPLDRRGLLFGSRARERAG